MSRSISIADIARAANVSHSTVSRALRDSPLISAEVRARVQQIASEMGYVPNAIAQSLKERRTNTIGLVVTTIADPFYADVTKGVEETARPAGLSVFLSATYGDPMQELAAIETFRRRQVDGIIVISSRIEAHHRERLRRTRLPIVVVNSQASTGGHALTSVLIDDYAGAHLAMRHLLTIGHRRIAYIGVSNRPFSNERRHAAYIDALRAAGITPDPALTVVAQADPGPEADDVPLGAAALTRLLPLRPTAVFCYNDMLAIGALQSARAHGLSVPKHLSLVGFDDIATAQYVEPPLTTVAQPRLELGRRAMQMLHRLLAGQPVTSAVLKPDLTLRASTGPPDRNQ